MVVDDHYVIRYALAKLLEHSPRMLVIGQASDGGQAIRMALETLPDVILMDYSMPVMNGASATRAILAILPKVIVIGLSADDADHVAKDMLAAGAFRTLAKSDSVNLILQSIHQALE